MLTNLIEVSKESKDIKYQINYSITKDEATRLFNLGSEIFYTSLDNTESIVESIETIRTIDLMNSDIYIKKYYI